MVYIISISILNVSSSLVLEIQYTIHIGYTYVSVSGSPVIDSFRIAYRQARSGLRVGDCVEYREGFINFLS